MSVRRLSVYFRCLAQLEEDGVKTISSQELAARFHLNSAQVRKDLAYFGEFGIRGIGYDTTNLRAEIQQVLRTFGLTEARNYYPHKLSGGMRQRAAIARALATQPSALLLDEPFSALDVVLRRRMQQFIREIWEQKRTTMIMVTHSIEEALLCAQRIIVLGGRPSGVLQDIDVRAHALKDRYSPEFAAAQRRLEELIDSEKSDPLRAPDATDTIVGQPLAAGGI